MPSAEYLPCKRVYYMYANIMSLNQWRHARGFSTSN